MSLMSCNLVRRSDRVPLNLQEAEDHESHFLCINNKERIEGLTERLEIPEQ
jgi:hypothetical protein